jgi:prevent-host-death family protein
LQLTTSRRGPDGYIRTRYSPADVDAIGAYCGALDKCFLIPIGDVVDQHAVQLRLAPARNGQRAALNWAEQYELGAVAQLAERRRGTAEARGSNPLSSIEKAPDLAGGAETVGAHQFRNHFGYYLERASEGTEVLISRRGRPYARLVPPDLKPKPLAADD